MRIVEPSGRFMESNENQKLMRQMLIEKLTGRLSHKEIRTLFDRISFIEEYSLFKASISDGYDFIKEKIGVPSIVKKAEKKHESLWPFDEKTVWEEIKNG